MDQYDPRVDAYIAKCGPFAQPILQHLRQLIHTAAPMAAETIKWGFPFFEYKGPVCQLASFKQHMAFGFWKARQINDPGKLLHLGEPAAGSFGKITILADLPSDDILIDFIKQAIQLNEAEKVTPVKNTAPPKAPKAAIEMPADFAGLLAANEAALAIYEKFSPSHKREYLEWILDAKTEETRKKRLQTAIEQINEGKSRHWKYK